MDSTFLSIPPDVWVASNDLAFAVRDIHPVSPGHTLVIPRHHVPDWWSTSAEQRTAIWDLVDVVKADLDRDFVLVPPLVADGEWCDRHRAGVGDR